MKKLCLAILVAAAFTAGACGGDSSPAGDVHEDGVTVNETANPDATTLNDTTGRDTNQGDSAHADTNTPSDTNQADANPGDIGVDDGAGPDDTVTPADTTDADVPADTVVPVDTVGPDISEAACQGECDYGTDSMWCVAGGLSICYCGENGQWSTMICSTVCENSDMVGDQCVVDGQEQYCSCQYDCNDADMVANQCENQQYTPCTCAENDPCKWYTDGWCDMVCEINFPDDHFTERTDCDCVAENYNPCSSEGLLGFCDVDNGVCLCVDGQPEHTACSDFCTGLNGSLIVDDWCYMDDEGMPNCNCENFKCDDADKVAAQCAAFVLSECTCAAADPCGWVSETDEYCDTPACRDKFPDMETFDDTATPACQKAG